MQQRTKISYRNAQVLNEKLSFFNIWLNAWFLFREEKTIYIIYTIFYSQFHTVIIMTFYVDPWSIVNVSDVVTTTNKIVIMIARESILLINGRRYALTFLYWKTWMDFSCQLIISWDMPVLFSATKYCYEILLAIINHCFINLSK